MQEYFASCLANLEPLLDRELRTLGAKQCRPLTGGVAFYAEPESMYRICLWSRLASRISLVLGRSDASDSDSLYDGAKELPWEAIIGLEKTFIVHAHGTNDNLRNSHFTELRVKDAIADRITAKRGKRPEVSTDNPDVMIDVRVRWDKATISLDMTGGSLYLRSYLDSETAFKQSHEVAMAAGMLAAQKWNISEPVCLVDPSCGQGHLLVEAALMAADVAPSLARSNWGFYGWGEHDDELWASVLDDADARYEAGIEAASKAGCLMMGVASYPNAIALAKEHAKRAGVAELINFSMVETEATAPFFNRLQQHLSNNNMNTRVMSLVSSQIEMLEGDSLELAIACEICRIVKASDYALIGGNAAVIRFGVEPIQRLHFGSGKVACDIVVFDKPPVELAKVVIPDSFGGADHVVTVRDEGAVQFADRLRKVAKERRKWAAAEGIRCYRVYDADLPEYSAAIDVYEGAGKEEGQVYLHIAEYEAPATIDAAKAVRRFDDIVALAPVVMGIDPKHVFTKVRRRDKGGSQYVRDKVNYVTHTMESGHVLEIDLDGYLDTGIFLDHRTTRQMVGKMAEGKRFLNLFAYTGTATVHAAAGGAIETTTVDLSQTYLEWAVRNMELNGFTGPEHMYERGDVIRWIDRARGERRRFDLIFVDPPTFSNSKSMGKNTWDVQRDHAELLIGVSRLLAKGGVAVFSCNLRNFKPDYEKLAKFGVELTDITAETIPHDYERNPKIHKCYLVKRVLAPKTNVIEIPQEVEEDEVFPPIPEVAAAPVAQAEAEEVVETEGTVEAEAPGAQVETVEADQQEVAPAAEAEVSVEEEPEVAEDGQDEESEVVEGAIKVGDEFEGMVVGIKTFGAFVRLNSETDGLIHISRVANGRVGAVEDVLSEGEMVKVKVIEIGEDGKVKLDRLNKPEAPKSSFQGRRDDRRGSKPRGDRSDFKPRGDRKDFKPRRDNDRDGERRDFKPRGDRDGFKSRRDDDRRDFKPRGDSDGFKPRRDDDRKDFKPRGGRDGFKPRRDNDRKDFKPRGDRDGFKRDGGPKREGGFNPRSNGGRGHRGQSGFKPRNKQ